MSEEIIKILDELGKRFGMAIDWSNQNVMPYLQDLMGRFIVYKNAQAIIWIFISIVAILLSIYGIKKIIKWSNSENFHQSVFDDDETIFVLGIAGLIVSIIIFTIIIVCNFKGIAQNIFIPELTVLEYLKGGLK